jgi:hypothetical protein
VILGAPVVEVALLHVVELVVLVVRRLINQYLIHMVLDTVIKVQIQITLKVVHMVLAVQVQPLRQQLLLLLLPLYM